MKKSTFNGLKIFAEGEFFEVPTHWHIQVPCSFNPETSSFEATVKLEEDAKFQFYYIDENNDKILLWSSQYEVMTDFDG